MYDTLISKNKKMTTTKDVYHLIFDIECKIIKVPTNQDIFHEEYTLEDFRKMWSIIV